MGRSRLAWVTVALVSSGLAAASRGHADPPFATAHAVFDDRAADRDDREAPSAAAPRQAAPPRPRAILASGCSEDMVRVGRFCIDRYEASMVDADTDHLLSPYYPPTPKLFLFVVERWTDAVEAAQDEIAREFPFPPVPAWQRGGDYVPKAVSRAGVVPQGYSSRNAAAAACGAAGKRLCTLDEWTTACEGERHTKFPYGPTYRQGACNVFRDDHPARILHGSFSEGHLDPRLNLVALKDGPLLRETGATPACKSTWGKDAVYDMVGNLDEWVDDPGGTFVGGFYSRSTRNGCEAKVTTHPASYFDYSTGVRCCDSARPSSGNAAP